MSAKRKLDALLAQAREAAAEEARAEERRAARVAWAKQAIDAMFAAQKRVQDAWTRIFDALPDDLSDEEIEKLPEPPEQAEVDALWAEIEAVRDHDRWPRGLHWGDV